MKKYPVLIFLLMAMGCQSTSNDLASRTSVIFDTDANNEIDDQHAMAYLFLNGNTFDVVGVTVNATRSGGDISKQAEEAERIMKLCTVDGKFPLVKGANGSFGEISNTISNATFDGSDAVNFIIAQARKPAETNLILIAVGKLTNLALALKKDPAISKKLRVVWLGSNYPHPGEYNLDNDTSALSYVLRSQVEFEMVTVRYGDPTGSGAVQATHEEIRHRMPRTGPDLGQPITGRQGGSFINFGDYSVDLFDHIGYKSVPEARSLYDMVAVAIVKNPGWGHRTLIPAPAYRDNKWVAQPANTRKIAVWENFDKLEIMKDFYATMEHWVVAK